MEGEVDTVMRSRAARWAAMLAAAVLVWIASGELGWPARALTTFLVAVLPVLLLVQADMAEELPDRVPRGAVYLSSAAAIWLLAAVAVVAAIASGFTPRLLGLLLPSPAALAGWTLGATAAGLLLMAAARALRVRESPLMEHLLPRSTGEKIAFVGLSFSAGIGEELVFRAFLIPAITAASGSTVLAIALSSGVFGMVHSYQLAGGVIRATLLGVLLALPFWATGSIVPSMIAHTALDVIAGLWLADWLLER